MAEKNSFILYLEYADILQDTTDEQFGRLMRHLFAHASGDEVTPEADVAIAYRFITNQMDRDAEKYDEKIEGRRRAGSVGGKKRAENAKNEQENLIFSDNSKQIQANQANATFASNFQANSSKPKQIQANASKVKQSQANQADNDNETVNGNVNDNVSVTDTVNVGSAQDALPVEKSVEKSVSVERESFDFVFDGQSQENSESIPLYFTVKKYCDENHPNVNAQDFYDYYKEQGWCCNGKPIKNWRSLLKSWAKHQRDDGETAERSYDIDEFVRLAMSRPFDERG
jgi:hypothetical protein